MFFTKEDKIFIEVLSKENGYSVNRFVKEFLNSRWTLLSSNRLLKEIDQIGTVDRKPDRGIKRLTGTVENVDSVENLAVS